MAELTDEQLYNMSDEELEELFQEAKADLNSPETGLDNDNSNRTVDSDDEFEDEGEEEIEFDEDVEEDEEVENLEQPDEDSDDDTSSEDEDEDDSEEDPEETEEDDLDGDSDEDEADATEDEEESEEDERPVQRRKYRANGKDFEFSDDEIFEKFGEVFGQAMNYTQKMQQIKPWRKTIDAIEQANLSNDDLNLAIDVLKGDKDAIAALLKRTGTDALDLDVENSNYVPKDYGRNDTELDIKDIVNEISRDKEYATTYDVLERQWDAKSREAFVDNPELIRQLHIDVKSGMYDTIAPIANKMKVYDGGKQSDLDYYKMAANQYFTEQAQDEARQEAQRTAQARRDEERAERERIQEVKAKETKRKAIKKASGKRKAAAPTKRSSKGKTQVDYLDGSDEGFEAWYKELQDKI